MQAGDRFEVAGTRMVVKAIERGRLVFTPEADPSTRYSVSGADMAAIVRAHVKRTRKALYGGAAASRRVLDRERDEAADPLRGRIGGGK
jgi:hypothetical protein